jgi:hypothetical protein
MAFSPIHTQGQGFDIALLPFTTQLGSFAQLGSAGTVSPRSRVMGAQVKKAILKATQNQRVVSDQIGPVWPRPKGSTLAEQLLPGNRATGLSS